MSEIWAIVLAAGESKRMNAVKMLLPFDGKTIIEKVIENISNSDVFKTLIVTGAYKEEIQKVTKVWSVVHCHNDNYKEGMLSSVKCGFRSIPSGVDAVLVFPGDQPEIKSDVINQVISAYLQTNKGIIIPVYIKKRGHPVLIDLKYRSEIEKLDSSVGLRALSQLFPEDVFEFETDSPAILKDIDNYEDYINANNQIR
jgi:CTP:molybdopterin cytidylyltransferase MocA